MARMSDPHDLLVAAGDPSEILAALGGGGPLPDHPVQDEPPAETNNSSSDQVGPRDLQDFNLQGTVTRPAEQPTPEPSQEEAR